MTYICRNFAIVSEYEHIAFIRAGDHSPGETEGVGNNWGWSPTHKRL